MITRFLQIMSLVVFVALAYPMASCGGISSAVDTQASLPIPDNSGITISSPNSEGYVVITGSEAVPASSTVIVNVDSSTARLDLQPLWDVLVPSAQAVECQSDLPVCPEVDGNEECQYTASADGSFTLQVPADISDIISVSYLDPTTCVETEVFSGAEVDNDTPALSFFGYDAALDDDNSFLYVAGLTENSEGVIAVLNTSTYETVSLETQTDLPLGIDVFDDDQGNKFIVTEGSSATYLSNLDNASQGDISVLNNFVLGDLSGNVLSNLKFLGAYDYDAVTDTYSPCGYLPGDMTNPATSTYTRAFFTDDTSIYFHEFKLSITSADLTTISTINGEDAILLRPLEVTFEDLDDEVIMDIDHLSFEASNAHIVVGIESPSLADYPETVYYYEKKPWDMYYCHTLSLKTNTSLEVGTSEDELRYQHATWEFEGNTSTSSVLAIYKTGETEQELYIVDNEGLQNYFHAQFDLASQTVTASTYTGGVLDGTTSWDWIGFTEPVSQMLAVPNSTTDTSDLVLISPYYGGSMFFGNDQTTSEALSLANSYYALYPLDVSYDSTNDQVIILDIGLSSTDATSDYGLYTLVRFYELNSSE